MSYDILSIIKECDLYSNYIYSTSRTVGICKCKVVELCSYLTILQRMSIDSVQCGASPICVS